MATNIRYIGSGDPTDDQVCTVFGHTFPINEWVTLDDPPVKLLANSTFEVDGAAVADEFPEGYSMTHRGFGKYEVTAPGLAEPKTIKGKKDAKTFIDGLIEAAANPPSA